METDCFAIMSRQGPRKTTSRDDGGALPKRSTMDLVASFVYEAEWALAKGQKVSMVTMDVKGAFDALLRRRLL